MTDADSLKATDRRLQAANIAVTDQPLESPDVADDRHGGLVP
jgi:hypothetical protein